MGTSRDVFESLPSRDGPSSTLFENSKNLASSSCGLKESVTGKIMEQGEGLRREPQGSTTPHPRVAGVPGPSCRAGQTYLRKYVTENPRHPISDVHLGKSQTQWTFSAGRSI